MASQSPLQEIPRHELVAAALQLGVPRPETLTELQLKDRIKSLSEGQLPSERLGSGWFSVARHLVASVVEQGFNLPDAARVIRPPSGHATEPRQPLPTVTLARIYLSQGHAARARKVLEAVLAHSPKDADTRCALQKLDAAGAPQQEVLPLGDEGHAHKVKKKPEQGDAGAAARSNSRAVPPSVGEKDVTRSRDAQSPATAQSSAEAAAQSSAGAAAVPLELKGSREAQLSGSSNASAALLLKVEGKSRPDYWLYWEQADSSNGATTLIKVARYVPAIGGAVEQGLTLVVTGTSGLIPIAPDAKFLPPIEDSEPIAGAEPTLRAALGLKEQGAFRVKCVAANYAFDAGAGRLCPEDPTPPALDQALVHKRACTALGQQLGTRRR